MMWVVLLLSQGFMEWTAWRNSIMSPTHSAQALVLGQAPTLWDAGWDHNIMFFHRVGMEVQS